MSTKDGTRSECCTYTNRWVPSALLALDADLGTARDDVGFQAANKPH
jgi:hypothetical protein